jgi:hypothetical protein
MNKVWYRAGGAMALASAATWATAAGCSSSSSAPSNAGPPGVDAAIESGPTPDDSGAPPVDDAGAEASAPGLKLLWNVVTTKAAPDGGAGADGGAASADAGLGGDAAASTNVPIEGAQVCVYQNTSIPCVTSAGDGTFTMSGIPAMADIVLTVIKDGYRATLRAVETASTNMDGTANPISLLSATVPDPPVPVTIDWQNKGQLTLFAIAPLADAGNTYGGDPGATVVLTPMSGSGPYFLHDDGTYDLSATSFVDVPAQYFNLAPGNYELTFTDTIHNCAPISSPFGEWGYPAPPTSAKFPIVAGYVTGPIGIFCTAK